MAPNGKSRELKTEAVDIAHAATRVALSVVPGASELFSLIVSEPISRRRDEWIASIEERLLQLQRDMEGFSAEKLKDDPAFVTTLMTATHAAMRTHQEEKLSALRNAVINSALGGTPDENVRQIYLRLVESITPLHLAVLSFVHSPTSNPDAMRRIQGMTMGGFSDAVYAAVPQLVGQKEVLELICRELSSYGLMGGANLNTTMSAEGMKAKRTTEFGDRFLEFISKRETK